MENEELKVWIGNVTATRAGQILVKPNFLSCYIMQYSSRNGDNYVQCYIHYTALN